MGHKCSHGIEQPCPEPSGGRSALDGRLSRREFVQGAAMGAASLAACPRLIGGAQTAIPDSAKVLVVHHKDACPIVDEYRPADVQVVKLMVGEALQRMGIGRDVAEIVRRWCPSGKTPATARVKIKFCGTRGLFPVHPGVVNGVARLLIDEAGVKPENIHAYENCPKNFGEDDRPPIFGTPFARDQNREPGVVYSHLRSPDGVDMPDSNYRETIRLDLDNGKSKEYTFWYWEALEKDCDILINVAALKRHIGVPRFTMATVSMKNHYGSIRDPYRHHGPEIGEKIAAVNLARPIRQKQRLIVVDALYAMYTRGPERGRMKYGINQLLVTADPVAADYVGWGMLNALETCEEPREIAIAARNGLGVRGANWQDHLANIAMT